MLSLSQLLQSSYYHTLPYTENFDNGKAAGLHGGTTLHGLWNTSQNRDKHCWLGTNSWVTELTGTYNASEKSYVVGPCFNFSNLIMPVFEMKAWWNSEFSNDGAVLQSSIDGGVTWQNVGAKGDGNNWFNDNSIDGAPGNQNPVGAEGWTGTYCNQQRSTAG